MKFLILLPVINCMENLDGFDDVYIVDTKFLGHDEHVASFIIDDEKTAILETGASTGVEHIFDALDELGISTSEVDYIIPTHVHLDHAGGAGYLADECENATLLCHEWGVDYLTDDDEAETLVESVKRAVGGMSEGYGDIKTVERGRFEIVKGGEVFGLGEKELEIVYAPGHAPHQFCVFERESQTLFTADEAGMYLKEQLLPTTPPPNFDLQKNLESLENLKEYEPSRLVYTHYGVREDGVEALDEYAEV
ncbi:MAG: MBL fold metallo-hydrolase, partial [Halobacteria archaeon]|nr:MBL fold metallo-hydrolase [Halobacteria archaeon]